MAPPHGFVSRQSTHWTLTALFLPDLSFNNIEAIEGLDTLVNLEDLSLFNNRISKIDSLDALVKLQVLSLGNNQIGNMMNVSSRLGTGMASPESLLARGRGRGWTLRVIGVAGGGGGGSVAKRNVGLAFQITPSPRKARNADYSTSDWIMFKHMLNPCLAHRWRPVRTSASSHEPHTQLNLC